LLIKEIPDRKGDRIVAVAPDATVAVITEILSRECIGALVVTDENGRLTGIVSERDIIEASAAHGPDVFEMPVSALMTKSLITCVGEIAL